MYHLTDTASSFEALWFGKTDLPVSLWTFRKTFSSNRRYCPFSTTLFFLIWKFGFFLLNSFTIGLTNSPEPLLICFKPRANIDPAWSCCRRQVPLEKLPRSVGNVLTFRGLETAVVLLMGLLFLSVPYQTLYWAALVSSEDPGTS